MRTLGTLEAAPAAAAGPLRRGDGEAGVGAAGLSPVRAVLWPMLRPMGLRLALGLAASASAFAVQAQDVTAGRQKAQACAVCHGPVGLAIAPDAPNLAGQSSIYVSRQLHHYRSGERKHAVMNVMAKPLSDKDIDDLAAWFQSIKVEVTAPP